MSEEHVLDILPAYVMGCLEKEESQAVAAHLDWCECCRVGYQAYSRILEDLPLRIALSEPPPEIREKILQRARQEGKLPQPASSNNRGKLRLQNALLAWFGLSVGYMLVAVYLNFTFWRRLRVLEESGG